MPHVPGSVLQYMTDFMIILCLDEKSHLITHNIQKTGSQETQ